MSLGLVWIDATQPAAGWRLWGMNLVERQVRQAALRGFSQARVWVSPASRESVQRLRPDFARLYPLRLEFSLAERPGQPGSDLEQADCPVVLLAGDTVWDERLLAHLLERGPGTAVVEGAEAVAFLRPEQACSVGRVRSGCLGATLTARAAALGVQLCRPADLDPYVPSLRLQMPPYLVRVKDTGQLRSLDRLLYHRTFKGVIDAVARYGYYHLVRWITRHLSRTALPPDLFTLLSLAGIWGAIPLLALGHLGAGAVVAWLGVILDSVDGKLARLTLHLNEGMGRLEHLAAMPGLGLWYAALGWHCTAGALLDWGPMALATWGLLAAFVADKAVSGAFKARHGRELFDYRPMDAAFHLVASRRNISLLLLSGGALLDQARLALALMAGWMGFTLLFHGGRWLWVEIEKKTRRD